MYIDSSGGKAGDNAVLLTPSISGQKCMTFWYHMFGPHVDTLNVYLTTDGKLGTPIHSIVGTQGDRWHSVNHTVNAAKNYQVSPVIILKQEGYTKIHFSIILIGNMLFVSM